MKLYQQLAEALVRHEVGTVFGLIGDANMFFVDHFAGPLGGRYVPSVHEASAVMMAAGHARVTGRVGVATVTHGPGLSNIVTALIECVKGRVPVVVIVGDTATETTYHSQDVEQRPLIVATGAGFVQARSPRTVTEDLATAMRQAHVERRAVVLNVPTDFMWAEVSGEPAAPLLLPVAARVQPDADELDRALGIIAGARRPIVLAGQGAFGARGSLVALANALGAPVATTMQAKDLFHGEPAHLGIFGSLATPAAQQVIADSDCILAFGAGLNPHTTARGDLVGGKAVVHCDIDPAAFGRWMRPDATVQGDAASVAAAMLELLGEVEHEPSSFSGARTQERIAAWPPLVDSSTSGVVDMRTTLQRIDAVLPAERTTVVDVGRFALHALRVMHAPGERGWLNSGAGFAAIGLGVPMAIGAAVGRPDRATVVVSGDGGFMLGGVNEFVTAVHEGLDLICIVCNDTSYGAEHIQLTQRSLDPSISLLAWPDLVAVAEVLGGSGIVFAGDDDLARVAAAVENRQGPLLIEIRSDPGAVSSPDD